MEQEFKCYNNMSLAINIENDSLDDIDLICHTIEK